MGLFSDYLEECRDRCAAGDIDPCLIISTKNGYGNYNKVYKQLEEYSQTDLGKEQRMQLQKQLIQNSAELENCVEQFHGFLKSCRVFLSDFAENDAIRGIIP